MTPPPGTFLATVRNGAIQFPKPIREYCREAGWDLFRVTAVEDWRLELIPVLEGDTSSGFDASLPRDGPLWIPSDLRTAVSLGEQSVMVRVDEAAIHIYLRRVFETLGFRP